MEERAGMMGWFRKNRRLGLSCAVFALACQLAASFAHVHAWGFGPHSAALSSRISAQPDSADQPPHSLSSAPVPGLPEPSGDDCPICTMILLAGSSLLPAVPVLALLTVVGGNALAIDQDGERIISLSILFQARAPPLILRVS
jgi:hypothetical protein